VDTYMHMVGNLVADPKQTATANGHKVTKFRIAANGRRFDQTVKEFVDTDPVYMSITSWRQLGDNVMRSLRKGDTVLVYGRVRFSEYDDAKSGTRRQSYEIDALSIGPDLNKYVTELTRPQRDLPAASEETPTTDAVPAQPDGIEVNPWHEPATVGAEEAA